ncbi:hypothetical protein ACJJTC_011617 [Scirpophaga incertulas]
MELKELITWRDPDNSENPEDVEDKYFSVLSKIDQQLNAINITKERTPSTPVSCKINLPNIVLNTFNDMYTSRAFQMERDTEEEPTIAAFLAYMEKRALALENADPGYKSSGQHRQQKDAGLAAFSATNQPVKSCILYTEFYLPSRIDLLMGADVVFQVLLPQGVIGMYVCDGAA